MYYSNLGVRVYLFCILLPYFILCWLIIQVCRKPPKLRQDPTWASAVARAAVGIGHNITLQNLDAAAALALIKV